MAVVFAAFSPCLENGFTNWDDERFVAGNPLVRDPSGAGLIRECRPYQYGSQGPVAVLSLALDNRLFGLDPEAFHRTALVLHGACCLVLFLLFRLMGLERSGALLGALLFGVHPMHVESVAWAAERKDLLCALFFFGSMAFHQRRLARPSSWCYLLSLASFLLALASKPMAVTLPVVLLLQDFLARRAWSLRLLVEKIPFFLFAGAAAILTLAAQAGAMPVAGATTLGTNALIALRGLAFYLVKLAVPAGLSAFYPYPERIGLLEQSFLGSALLVIAAAAAVLLGAKRSRRLAFGALFFFVTILPVLKLVPVGNAAAADRYTYIPSAGLFLAAGALFAFLLGRLRVSPGRGADPAGREKGGSAGREKADPAGPVGGGAGIPAGKTTEPSVERSAGGRAAGKAPLAAALLVFAAGGWVAGLGAAAHERCKVWRDSATLWRDVIAKYPDVSLAHYNLGVALHDAGDDAGALACYGKAAALDPGDAEAWNNMAHILWLEGKYDDAERSCRRAIRIAPGLGNARLNLSRVLNATGRFVEALGEADAALAIDGGSAEAWLNRGIALVNLGRIDAGRKSLERAAILEPDLEEEVRRLEASIEAGRRGAPPR